MKIFDRLDKTTIKVGAISYVVISFACDIASGHLSILRDLVILLVILSLMALSKA